MYRNIRNNKNTVILKQSCVGFSWGIYILFTPYCVSPWVKGTLISTHRRYKTVRKVNKLWINIWHLGRKWNTKVEQLARRNLRVHCYRRHSLCCLVTHSWLQKMRLERQNVVNIKIVNIKITARKSCNSKTSASMLDYIKKNNDRSKYLLLVPVCKTL